MPVRIPNTLPAATTLANENIFVMHEDRASHQDIRPLRVAILNLMPTKEATETQLLRLIGNSPLQVEPVLLKTASYQPTHTDAEYLDEFYRTFDEVKNTNFDGLIVTGAPIELMPFEDVKYWNELTEVMDWAQKHVFSSMYICWGAQAALYYKYGIQKYELPVKLSGVYRHRVLAQNVKLLRGFDDVFNAPHSRNTEVRRADIDRHPELAILAESDEAGVYLVADQNMRNIYITGHSEYDVDTLEKEYLRDLAAGKNPRPPENYFPGGDVTQRPLITWRGHANLLFSNWLNYCVYQETPFDISSIG